MKMNTFVTKTAPDDATIFKYPLKKEDYTENMEITHGDQYMSFPFADMIQFISHLVGENK